MTDSGLHRFLFEGCAVRGAVVRLTASWQEALRRRGPVGAFPAPVRSLLGEMTAACVLMRANIKFDGALVLQLHGDGPLKLAVAEVRTDYSFRATGKVVAEVPAAARLGALANAQGNGRCAIVLDARGRAAGTPPYQGMVSLCDDRQSPLDSFSAVMEHYMLQSEQIATRMVLAANDEVAAGVVLQRMPESGIGNLGGGRTTALAGFDEDFHRLSLLAATLRPEELLGLDVDSVLHRLFWQEGLRRFEPLVPRFRCSCDPERVVRMLVGLGRQELDSILAEQGRVEIGCDFCGQQYRFDAVDVGEMFTAPLDHPPSTTTLQ